MEDRELAWLVCVLPAGILAFAAACLNIFFDVHRERQKEAWGTGKTIVVIVAVIVFLPCLCMPPRSGQDPWWSPPEGDASVGGQIVLAMCLALGAGLLIARWLRETERIDDVGDQQPGAAKKRERRAAKRDADDDDPVA